MIKLLVPIVLLHILGTVHAQVENFGFDRNPDQVKPWTSKPFYNDPENFQFAIVSDRTGGHRQGVFGKGLEKINQLYPEFVMSVGDLIEGYTKDTVLLNEQWNEFHGILDSLSTRFFYVAGNHDYSNDVMAKQWKERYGKSYYRFIYKNVLFLVVNTNDGDGVLIGKDQIEFLKETIAQNADVRWTMIFMHHPLWSYGEVNGFDEVEEALKGRDYTVYAGHTHRYLHEVRNDKNHYVLGTTGGGSQLRGPKFGEFDHIGWITMTNDGPKLVNLALSGVLEQDVSNKTTQELAVSLINATDFQTLVMAKGKERRVLMSLENNSDKIIHFRAQLYHNHHVQPDSSQFQLSLSPHTSHLVNIKTHPGTISESDWDPLELEWQMGYDKAFMEPQLSLDGTEIIELKPSNTGITMTEQNIFFEDFKIDLAHPYKNMDLRFTTDGTNPTVESTTLTAALNVKETTNVKARLTDKEGYQSAIFEKTFKRVKPMRAVKVKKPVKGLNYSYYEDAFTSVPDFKSLQAIKKGSVLELDPDKIGGRLDHYAIQYSGYISVPETGIYTFHLKSDDGSKLYLHDELVVDNDGSHSAKTETGMVALKKGLHPVRIDYFEDFLEETLELEYTGPGLEKSNVSFFR